MKSRVSLLVTLSVIALMWVLHTASKNFVVDPDFTVFLGNKDIQLPSIALWFMMIRIPIILAIIALITGPLGLSLSIRMKRPALHRWNGRIYVLSILLNILPGYYVAFYANGGVASVVGFLILNTLWMLTTINGYRAIRKKQVRLHRIWRRSYSLAVWLAVIINLLVAEWVVRKSRI